MNHMTFDSVTAPWNEGEPIEECRLCGREHKQDDMIYYKDYYWCGDCFNGSYLEVSGWIGERGVNEMTNELNVSNPVKNVIAEVDKKEERHIIYTVNGNVKQAFKKWNFAKCEEVLKRLGAEYWEIG